ncbi:MAG TPA: hypothetical protein VFT71_07380, partial [Candidatus Nitrosocosmicus sp.]|nr:hypothetical protein [Candidatus Nitrosocosmicus sp.]
ALTTSGLTAGITEINMDVSAKILLIVNMIIGRFEIIALIYLFLEISKVKKIGVMGHKTKTNS